MLSTQEKIYQITFSTGIPTGFPVVLFSYQKSQFRHILEGLGMENVCAFYDHFNIFYSHLVLFYGNLV
jgi:hypothetical protein